MDHEELATRLERRIDRLEAKLDKFLELENSNRADLNWVKGYIKLSLSAIIGLITGLATVVFRVFFNNV